MRFILWSCFFFLLLCFSHTHIGQNIFRHEIIFRFGYTNSALSPTWYIYIVYTHLVHRFFMSRFHIYFCIFFFTNALNYYDCFISESGSKCNIARRSILLSSTFNIVTRWISGKFSNFVFGNYQELISCSHWRKSTNGE